MKNSKRKNREEWSARSQRSLMVEHRLKGQLSKLQHQISNAESKNAALDKRCAALAQSAATLGPIVQPRLNDALVELEGAKRVLAALKEQAINLQAKIETPPPASEAAARRQQQNLLALLARERLGKDRLLDDAVKNLSRLLSERHELSRKMSVAAQLIDFTLAIDGLDIARFDSLAESLPGEIADTSENWLAWFLGIDAERGTTIYRVEDETLTLPETLAHPHFYKRGDRVALTEEQAAEVFPKPPERSIPVPVDLDGGDGAGLEVEEAAISE